MNPERAEELMDEPGSVDPVVLRIQRNEDLIDEPDVPGNTPKTAQVKNAGDKFRDALKMAFVD